MCDMLNRYKKKNRLKEQGVSYHYVPAKLGTGECVGQEIITIVCWRQLTLPEFLCFLIFSICIVIFSDLAYFFNLCFIKEEINECSMRYKL